MTLGIPTKEKAEAIRITGVAQAIAVSAPHGHACKLWVGDKRCTVHLDATVKVVWRRMRGVLLVAGNHGVWV